MGQKTNVNSLKNNSRVLDYFIWSSNNKNFKNMFYRDIELKYNVTNLLNFVSIFQNKIFIRRFSKKMQIVLVFISHLKTFSVKYTTSALKNFITKIRKKSLSSLPLTTTYFFFNILKIKKNQNQKKIIANSFVSKKKIITFSPYINSSVISSFIAEQLKISVKFKDKMFKQNLQKSIKFLLGKYYNKSKIIGLKVLCSGK